MDLFNKSTSHRKPVEELRTSSATIQRHNGQVYFEPIERPPRPSLSLPPIPTYLERSSPHQSTDSVYNYNQPFRSDRPIQNGQVQATQNPFNNGMLCDWLFQIKLPIFRGRPEENPEIFIRKFIREVNSINMSYHAMCNRFPGCLKETASGWFEATLGRLPVPADEQRCFRHWHMILDEFSRHYDTPARKALAKAQLWHRRQHRGESLRSYLMAMMRLADNISNPDELYLCVLQNLDRLTQKHFNSRGVHSFEEMLAECDMVEKDVKCEREMLQFVSDQVRYVNDQLRFFREFEATPPSRNSHHNSGRSMNYNDMNNRHINSRHRGRNDFKRSNRFYHNHDDYSRSDYFHHENRYFDQNYPSFDDFEYNRNFNPNYYESPREIQWHDPMLIENNVHNDVLEDYQDRQQFYPHDGNYQLSVNHVAVSGRPNEYPSTSKSLSADSTKVSQSFTIPRSDLYNQTKIAVGSSVGMAANVEMNNILSSTNNQTIKSNESDLISETIEAIDQKSNNAVTNQIPLTLSAIDDLLNIPMTCVNETNYDEQTEVINDTPITHHSESTIEIQIPDNTNTNTQSNENSALLDDATTDIIHDNNFDEVDFTDHLSNSIETQENDNDTDTIPRTMIQIVYPYKPIAIDSNIHDLSSFEHKYNSTLLDYSDDFTSTNDCKHQSALTAPKFVFNESNQRDNFVSYFSVFVKSYFAIQSIVFAFFILLFRIMWIYSKSYQPLANGLTRNSIELLLWIYLFSMPQLNEIQIGYDFQY